MVSPKVIQTYFPPISQRPDAFGRFGRFGGKYVPETLMPALNELEKALRSCLEKVRTTSSISSVETRQQSAIFLKKKLSTRSPPLYLLIPSFRT